MRWLSAVVLVGCSATHSSVQGVTVPPPLVSKPSETAVGEAPPSSDRCGPRRAAASAAHELGDSRRLQEALAIKYPVRSSDASTDPNAWDPEAAATAPRLEFVKLAERWGAEGPVPWKEVTIPELSRFIGPVSFHRTELWTGEMEYPWVATLVVARSADGKLLLDSILSPSFTDSADVLTSLTTAACAGSVADRLALTWGVATLYALGNSSMVSAAFVDGSCAVSEFRLYEDVWRYVAVDFGASGMVRGVHAFNPKDDSDTAERASICRGALASPSSR